MLTKSYTYIALLMVLALSESALFGEECTHSSECTDVNTVCVKYRECTTGICQCLSGYGNANGNACDKVLKHYNEPCDSNNICPDSNQECNSATARCACTEWNSYNTLAQACITVTRYVLTETCGGWWQLQCYITTANGGQCDGTCQCQEGYTMAMSETYLACRAPQYGEYCTSAVSCAVSFNTSTISDDSSSTAPRCLLNVCLCPPSHELKVVIGHNLCLNKNGDGYVLKENGDSCTHFNECASSLCVKCNGTTTGVCMANDDVSNDFATSVSPSLLQALIPPLTFAFFLGFNPKT